MNDTIIINWNGKDIRIKPIKTGGSPMKNKRLKIYMALRKMPIIKKWAFGIVLSLFPPTPEDVRNIDEWLVEDEDKINERDEDGR